MNQDLCQKFKKTLGRFATGVTVATTKYEGIHYGVTINSFTSLSLTPALILFNLGESSHSSTAFLNSEYFNINILSKNQKDLANHFAKSHNDKFSDIDYIEDDKGNSYFDDNLALISCKLHSSHKIGDHHIIIGEVYHMDNDDSKEPLIYYNSQFS
ncbi:MAG: flavin reductase [Rickettsiales bacterium]|jgi:flavin reductase (DIM6/NTAB) family NADH-FMN oxidoreductase RutF|nr:flavin reductase [Rickettsiales bacterium]